MSLDLSGLGTPKARPPISPFRILALSGGGYRGLFTAALLAKIEQELGDVRLHDRVDFLAGTSVGGLLALGLTVGIPAAVLRDELKKHGPSIFDQSFRIFGKKMPLLKKRHVPPPLRGVFAARYRAEPLEAAIKAILGPKLWAQPLSEIKKRLLLVTVSAVSAEPVLLTSGGLADAAQHASELSLLEAARATSAAPTYFPAQDLEHDSLIDGGLTANAPELVALAETVALHFATMENCRILAIGTAAPDVGKVPRQIGRRGSGQWLAAGLFDLTLTTQERLAERQLKNLLGPHYLRLDRKPSPKQAEALALDAADEKATRTLEMLANDVWKAYRTALMDWFSSSYALGKGIDNRS